MNGESCFCCACTNNASRYFSFILKWFFARAHILSAFSMLFLNQTLLFCWASLSSRDWILLCCNTVAMRRNFDIKSSSSLGISSSMLIHSKVHPLKIDLSNSTNSSLCVYQLVSNTLIPSQSHIHGYSVDWIRICSVFRNVCV